MPETISPDLASLLDAILLIVPFEGWSETAFQEAAAAIDMPLGQARALAPRGALDLAVAYHRNGDQALARLLAEDFGADLRYSERVTEALMHRLMISDREAVRAASALFALPIHAPEGAALIWETADTIWNGLGDTSRDGNWYSKRAILSGVYSSAVLYWLGDETYGENTRGFVERRVADVMRFEGTKARLRSSPLSPFMKTFDAVMAAIPAPASRVAEPDAWLGAATEANDG